MTLIIGSSDEEINKVASYLDNSFTIKDLGPLDYFMGIKIKKISQSSYFYH